MHMLKKSNALPAANKKVSTKNKFVLGLAALSASAIVGTTGIAAAAHQQAKPDMQDCKAAGYGNYGQCMKAWAKQKKSGGHGYGGNTINVGVDVTGDNNVINIIINIFR